MKSINLRVKTGTRQECELDLALGWLVQSLNTVVGNARNPDSSSNPAMNFPLQILNIFIMGIDIQFI